MWASCTDCVAAFFLASGPSLSQEAADIKINVQSACALNTVYYPFKNCYHRITFIPLFTV
jgi:hypothetical protein